ncbi:MAG: alpha-N-acetylglucosaminidase C-terminal domain-containing protein [Bacteroidales bacterium]|nr:alpha-N-acetylglucosaminidase C-terminal domain-containing protein [Bacteroidales bacterium]
MLLCHPCTAAAKVVSNPKPVRELLDRIGGKGASRKLLTCLDDAMARQGEECFCITSQKGKPYIKGSSISAITTGIGWYLNHHAHINLSWNQLTTTLRQLPVPTTEETHTCNADYRYYLNYCTFGYSMTTWTWDRWQKEIDWMALHGINMPLQIIGMEKVWKDLLMQDYGYSEDDAENFVTGPAFIAWWGMNNLEGWGGTHDDAWYKRQADLASKICKRERELGMQPVLPGFSGMVPSNFQAKTGHTIEKANKWCGFQRPAILDPTDSEFAIAAQKYYARLHSVMGNSRYYSMDPFHEGGTISSGKYSEGYKAVYDAMNDNCGSDTKWVIQQWQWAAYQRSSLTAVPAGRLIVLDLFADGQPAFDSYNGYAPQEAVFCTIPNFGGRSGFMGRLDNMASNYFTYKNKYSTVNGVGAAPEAIESVPVVYDLLFELPWMSTAPNMTEWVADYATSRYGTANANAQKAWEDIHQSAMAFGADAVQGPIEDVWAARPNLNATPASTWGKTIANVSNIYTPERRQRLCQAFITLVGERGNLSGSNYEYDLIEVGGQVMADYAYKLLLSIKAAKTAGDTQLFNQRKQLFLDLILDMDTFKGTHHMFRLGNWTQTARDAATEVKGATTATPDWYELDNARTIITTWGDKNQSEAGGLHDYSYRSWQGLLKDYYYPRWKYYFDHDCQAPSAGWFYSEWNWAHELEGEWGASAKGTTKAKRTYYSPTAEGNTVEEAKKLLTKYIFSQR